MEQTEGFAFLRQNKNDGICNEMPENENSKGYDGTIGTIEYRIRTVSNFWKSYTCVESYC